MKKKVNVYVSVCVFKTLPVYLKLAQLCQSTILQKKKKTHHGTHGHTEGYWMILNLLRRLIGKLKKLFIS